jgi:SagB-type dehydrogenase family enzyme
MRRPVAILSRTAVAAVLALLSGLTIEAQQPSATIRLPAARHEGAMSVEAALWARRSVRGLARDTLALADAAQLLWAAQGVNRPDGHRTAPSAGATYALEILLVASRVRDLPAGVYRYRPAIHALDPVAAGERLPDLVQATRQQWIGDAAAVIVLTAVYERTARRYGERAERYVPIEAGHAAENVYLQCAALGLGTTYVGSYSDTAITRVLALAPDERPLGLLPVGRPR